MEKGYWIYQQGGASEPWAIYAIRDGTKRKAQEMTLGFQIFHENISSPQHMRELPSFHGNRISDYVDAVVEELEKIPNVTVTSDDWNQLDASILNILLD